ncbi:hypothetical protein [Brevundimonas sp.]|uniref:hypothetical protein n=1 Tax=Brevundimonas sp. TaxID=1871086 RepID=UPI0028A11A61|nr:hypothetical protein [Brevundimonas sp.]
MQNDLREAVAHEIYDFLDERFPDASMPGGVQLFADPGDTTDANMNHEAGCFALADRILDLALGGQQGGGEADRKAAEWPSCVACEDKPAPGNNPCAVCGLTTPARAEAPDEEAATDDLVDRFAVALKAKLRAAGEKYGFDDAWKADDWRDKLIEDLLRHIQKGDPRDVAAYCAFAWHHDWSLSPKQDDLRSAAFTDRGAEDRYVSQDEEAAGEREAIIRAIRENIEVMGVHFIGHDHAADAILAIRRAPSSPPPAADEDRVRIAVEAIKAEINAPLTGPTHGAWDRGRIAGLKEALAALKTEGK